MKTLSVLIATYLRSARLRGGVSSNGTAEDRRRTAYNASP